MSGFMKTVSKNCRRPAPKIDDIKVKRNIFLHSFMLLLYGLEATFKSWEKAQKERAQRWHQLVYYVNNDKIITKSSDKTRKQKSNKLTVVARASPWDEPRIDKVCIINWRFKPQFKLRISVLKIILIMISKHDFI